MTTYVLQMTLCAGILLVPYLLIFRKETFFATNRAYLLSALVLSLAIPALPPLAPPGVEYLPTVTLTEFQIVTAASNLPEGEVTAGAGAWNWTSILQFGYALVACLLLARLLHQTGKLLLLYRRGSRRRTGGFTVVRSASIREPFSFFKVIFLPESVVERSPEYQYIVAHESVHATRIHSFDTLLVEILCAVFWANPFFYIYRREIRQIHEYEADDVIDDNDRIEYTQLLISQSQSGMRLSLGNHFFQSQLKSRILMMLKDRSTGKKRWKYSAAIPVICLSLLLFAFTNSDMPTAASGEVTEVDDSEVDVMPLYPGCASEGAGLSEQQQCSNARLMKHVMTELNYPAEARRNGIEGRVVVRFVVGGDGLIGDAEVLKGLGSGCDEEAVRVVRTLNSDGMWTPGLKDGKPVPVELTLPFQFNLSQEQDGGKRELFKVVDEMPRFPGCEDKPAGEREQCAQQQLYTYLGQNMKYPEDAKQKKIEGKVIVSFVVEPTGVVSTAKVIKGLHPSCDAEVIRLIEAMNAMDKNWIPGIQRGKNVAVQLTLPVMFKL